jgi:hypothetical protein
MASVRGILNIQFLNELTYENLRACSAHVLFIVNRRYTAHCPLSPYSVDYHLGVKGGISYTKGKLKSLT